MNCEQTREHLILHRQDDGLTGTKRQEFLEHLQNCKNCQVEYEGLWHTATMLESLDPPVPPPELLGNIQQNIREFHRQSKTAFFANPFSWLFNTFKIDLSPQFVNGIALLCYIVASAFIVKLAFFTDTPNQNLGLTAMEASRRIRPGQTSPSQLGSVKFDNTIDDKPHSTQVKRENDINPSRPFVDIKSQERWHNDTKNQATDNVDAHFPKTMNEKLTLFWNDIKTNL